MSVIELALEMNAGAVGIKLATPICKAILSALSEQDETAEICCDKDENPC